MAIMGRSYPNRPVISRGSTADAPVLTTRAPLVLTDAQARRIRAAMAGIATPVVIISRNSLQDAPVLTTPAPLVTRAGTPAFT